jgi:ATP-grasp ribosomal peptide maturase
LVVTCLGDSTADLVLDELHDRAIAAVRYDPGADFPAESRLTASFGSQGMSGLISTATRELRLTDVRSVYWRKPTPYRRPPALKDRIGRWVCDQSRYGLGGVLAALPGALYVNHPWRIRDAEYKPAQLATAAACGLAIPPTLISNDPDAARTFAAAGPIVYKPLWATPTLDHDGTAVNVWTQSVDPADITATVSGAAHLFQRQVDKVADVRVIVIGTSVFAVRIDGAPEIDWRRHYPDLSYTLIDAPPTLVTAMRAYLGHFKLIFGAFDFALTEKNEWIFLECNPNGQWAWFPDPIPARIAAAIASYLQLARDQQ